MDSASIIALAGGHVKSSSEAVANFLKRPGAEEPKDALEAIEEYLEHQKKKMSETNSAEDGKSEGKSEGKSKSDGHKSHTTLETGSGVGTKKQRFTLHFTEVVRCPASRMVAPSLLKKALNDKIVPQSCDWDKIEVDNRTGRLCLPPEYVTAINKAYKGTATASAANLVRAANDISDGKILPADGLTTGILTALGDMTDDQFDGTGTAVKNV